MTETWLDNSLYDYNYAVGQVCPVDPYVFLHATRFTCREYTCRTLRWQKYLVENRRIRRFQLYQSEFRSGRFQPEQKIPIRPFSKFQLIRLDIFLGHWSRYLLLFTNGTHMQNVGDESTRCVASPFERISGRILWKKFYLSILRLTCAPRLSPDWIFIAQKSCL